MTPPQDAPKFKEGDWAYSIQEGWSQVRIDSGAPDLISHGAYSYWRDGRQSTRSAQPSLFTEEEAFRLFGVKREKKKVKKRQLVEVVAWGMLRHVETYFYLQIVVRP